MTSATVGSGTPSEYTVHAVSTRTDAQIEIGSERLAVDARWPGQRNPHSSKAALPGPADLLASALAACVLKNVERCAALLPFDYDTAAIDVTARRQDRPPRFVSFDFRLILITDEPARRVELLHTNLRRYGTVHNTLAAVCEITGEVIAQRRAPESRGGTGRTTTPGDATS